MSSFGEFGVMSVPGPSVSGDLDRQILGLGLGLGN